MSETTSNGDRVYTLRRVDFLDTHPGIPAGASDFERGEITHHWRHALNLCVEIAGRVESIHEDVSEGARTADPGLGIAQRAADLAASIAAMNAARRAVIHRTALDLAQRPTAAKED